MGLENVNFENGNFEIVNFENGNFQIVSLEIMLWTLNIYGAKTLHVPSNMLVLHVVLQKEAMTDWTAFFPFLLQLALFFEQKQYIHIRNRNQASANRYSICVSRWCEWFFLCWNQRRGEEYMTVCNTSLEYALT